MSGIEQWALTYTYSPIFLTNGIAGNTPGGGMPIVKLLGGGENDFFASFVPLPGSTMIDQDAALYPFANQAVAANAVITKPLRMGFRMICPVKPPFSYPRKQAIMTGLQASLAKHNATGGTYTINTPAFVSTNWLMLDMTDASEGVGGENSQAQDNWQLNFIKPLLTLQDAEQAQNSLMSKVSSGTKIDGEPAWSGLPPTVGNPNSLASPNTVPPAQNVGGAGLAGRGGG